MLASGWRMGKLISLLNLLGLAVWEREMSEARLWPESDVNAHMPLSTTGGVCSLTTPANGGMPSVMGLA